jgi:tricarballylate dehydrogenase
MKADVVIVGCGLAGLVAGIEARSQGGSALILDKLPPPERWNAVTMLPGGVGNDTWRSGGGGLARFAGDTLVEHLVDGPGELQSGKDPVDVLLDRHMRLGWDSVDTALLRTYCSRVFNDCCWLRDEVKMPYDDTGRTVKGLGIGLFRTLHDVAKARGVQFSFDTCAERLLTDDDGRICGIGAKRGNETFDVDAGAVILATGGFQGDRDLLQQHAGATIAHDVHMVGSPENTGDGHRMAGAVGAQLRHMSVVHIRTTDFFFGQGPSRYLMHIYPMGLYFNRNFERFVDEGVADSDTIANAIAFQPGSVAGLVFDEKARAKYPNEF